MKRIITILIAFLLTITFVFANGTAEENQLFLENLLQSANQGQILNTSHVANSTGSEIISRDMATLERLYQYVEKNYLYDIDYEAVYEAMATALFDTLGDKYSYYVKASESEDYEETVTGTYGGLGIYFSKTYIEYQDPEDESSIYCNITQVFPNTPAARAGLKAQDFIIEIDGQSVNDLEATECAKKLKGPVGTTVDVTIKRKDMIFTQTIRREVIVVPTVNSCMLDEDIAYMVINEFSTGTATAVYDAISKMNENDIDGLVLDLRNCPGGDVDIALTIADMFIKDSNILTVSYKDPSKNVVYKASSTLVIPEDVKIAVLINGGTASSAEILSSALQGSKRAIVFGSKSYGKGIMQMISSFGTGFTSLTAASFVGPSGQTIHEEGVKPDVEIEEIFVQDEELEEYTELQKSGEVEAFVDENPLFCDENIQAFAQKYSDTGIRKEVLLLMARNEYYARMITDDIPVADIMYDNVCKAAYEYLRENKKGL